MAGSLISTPYVPLISVSPMLLPEALEGVNCQVLLPRGIYGLNSRHEKTLDPKCKVYSSYHKASLELQIYVWL